MIQEQNKKFNKNNNKHKIEANRKFAVEEYFDYIEEFNRQLY